MVYFIEALRVELDELVLVPRADTVRVFDLIGELVWTRDVVYVLLVRGVFDVTIVRE